MPFDYLEIIPPTDLGLFQVEGKEPIEFMNRLFYSSPLKTKVGFPNYWTSPVDKSRNEFYQKVDLLMGKHSIENSLWKYAKGNNHCPFNLEEGYFAFESLSEDLGFDVLSFGVDHIEVGVYFQLHFDLIKKLRMFYKGSHFDAMKKSRSREVYGWHLQLNQFEIKLYDIRAKQRLAGEEVSAPPGSYRFEIKYYDRSFLKKNGIGQVADLFEINSSLYAHWRNVTNEIHYKLISNIPHQIITSDIKNIMLYESDAFPEFERILKNKSAGKTELSRVKNSIKKYSHLLLGKVDVKKLLLEEFNRNLLLSGKKDT
jgi:hypothetical protein